uniref:Cadherin domain-containing protein n=1 Tax=Aquila chrysaetos chrysaetos TaxID=223781 RepID=A0A663EU04_AQUCH
MHGRLTFLLLLLLLSLRAPALPDLPRVVVLSEDAVPGTCVAKLTVSCSNVSGSPNVTLHGIEPGHPFNPIAIRSRAGLDARQVNQYTLTLRAACPGEDEVEERLFVQVTAGQALRCDTPFATAGRSQGATPHCLPCLQRAAVDRDGAGGHRPLGGGHAGSCQR